jgi:hypothetical protein
MAHLFYFSALSKQVKGTRDLYSKLQRLIADKQSHSSELTRTSVASSGVGGTPRTDSGDSRQSGGSPGVAEHRDKETYELTFVTGDQASITSAGTVTIDITGSLASHRVEFTPSGPEVARRVMQGKYRFPAPLLGELRKIEVEHTPGAIAAGWSAMAAGAAVESSWPLSYIQLVEESTTRMYTFVFTKVRPLVPGESQAVGPPVEGAEGQVQDRIIEECYENEHLNRISRSALPRETWTNCFGRLRLKDSYDLPDDTWRWDAQWEIDVGEHTDAEGWAYAGHWDSTEWLPEKRFTSQVRRRLWIRNRRRTPAAALRPD